jgi:hypothetical protein
MFQVHCFPWRQTQSGVPSPFDLPVWNVPGSDSFSMPNDDLLKRVVIRRRMVVPRAKELSMGLREKENNMHIVLRGPPGRWWHIR